MFNQKKIFLTDLSATLRYLLLVFILTLSLGTILGLIYVFQTTHFQPQGIEKRYGKIDPMQTEQIGSTTFTPTSEIEEDTAYYNEKTITEILMTTHNHLLSLAVIFFLVSLLIYFTHLPSWLKNILILEPFFSLWLTFGGIWVIRFIHPAFKYVVFVSSFLLYTIFFVNVVILCYELLILPKFSKKD